MGGEYDLRGFDIRSVSPVAYLPDQSAITLVNPDGSSVPRDPGNPLRGAYTIPIPVDRIVFPGGDTSLTGTLEYRFTVIGPLVIAPFVDLGIDPILRKSQLRINSGQLAGINNTRFGCPALDIALNCLGGQFNTFSEILQPVPGTNWTPRGSTGIEFQVMLPVINAPFRIYWAYNPLRLDTTSAPPVQVTRGMFPPGAAGDYTYNLAVNSFSPTYILREPRKTFRFTVGTSF
jgi:outer membrane protein insertion porin family